MAKTWTVEIEGKKHLVELSYPVEPLFDDDKGIQEQQAIDGKLVVDGSELNTWKPRTEFPKQINFEIVGKPAVLRKKGVFSSGLDLFVEGKLIKPT